MNIHTINVVWVLVLVGILFLLVIWFYLYLENCLVSGEAFYLRRNGRA